MLIHASTPVKATVNTRHGGTLCGMGRPQNVRARGNKSDPDFIKVWMSCQLAPYWPEEGMDGKRCEP